jgi:hypothetical protein
MEPEFLSDLRTLHTFLQSIRMPFKFPGFHPWSIFVVETRSFGDIRDFDYHDEILTLTFSIRIGEVGIIACLEDNGAQEEQFFDYFEKFKGIKLHPTQFDELVAKVTYKRHLMNRVPKYIMMFPKKRGIRLWQQLLRFRDFQLHRFLMNGSNGIMRHAWLPSGANMVCNLKMFSKNPIWHYQISLMKIVQ